MTHTIIEDLNWRHTVKKYDTEKKVSAEQLNVLLEAIRLSASSINSQPWRFIVIESDKAKERFNRTFLNKHQFNQKHVFDSSHIILFAYKTHYTRDDYAKVVDQGIADQRIKPEDRESAFGGFMFAELNMDVNGDTSCWTKAQTYLALGNALHVLARLKIGATPLEGIDSDLIQDEFKAELEGYQCDVALAIGYSHAEEDFNAKLPKSRLKKDAVFVRL